SDSLDPYCGTTALRFDLCGTAALGCVRPKVEDSHPPTKELPPSAEHSRGRLCHKKAAHLNVIQCAGIGNRPLEDLPLPLGPPPRAVGFDRAFRTEELDNPASNLVHALAGRRDGSDPIQIPHL